MVTLPSPPNLAGNCCKRVFQGIVRFNEEIGEYEIEAKESDMVWLSESELFKDYSVEDVIGKKSYDEYRKKRPDLL